jgi:hypothetical protein
MERKRIKTDRVKPLALVLHNMEAAGSYLRPCALEALLCSSLSMSELQVSFLSTHDFIYTSAYHHT